MLRTMHAKHLVQLHTQKFVKLLLITTLLHLLLSAVNYFLVFLVSFKYISIIMSLPFYTFTVINNLIPEVIVLGYIVYWSLIISPITINIVCSISICYVSLLC
jgi:hypothetical protein